MRFLSFMFFAMALPSYLVAQTGSTPTDPHAAAKQAALQQVNNWLILMDDASYGQSWDAAADLFKENVTKAEWQETAETVRAPLGKVISRTLIASHYLTEMPDAPEGNYVIVQYTTMFEHKEDALETVIPLLENGVWKVSGYHID